MAANGSGWSCNYNCFLIPDPDTSQISPADIEWKDGLVLCIRQLHFLYRSHLSKINTLKEKTDIEVFHCPEFLLCTIIEANVFVSGILRDLGIPTTGMVGPLSRVLFSHFWRRRRRSSDTNVVFMALDLNITAVVRNDGEYRDWLHGGTMNSVVVNTLRATKQAIEGLEKTKHDGACGGASECVVCLEEFGEGEEVTWLPCRHGYHGKCIREWLMTNHRCPICRSPVPWVSVLEDKTRTAADVPTASNYLVLPGDCTYYSGS